MTRELRLAPRGASDAECAVCAHLTGNRLVDGDGHIPMCSEFCLQAWPRVRALLADRDALRTKAVVLEKALRFFEWVRLNGVFECLVCARIKGEPHKPGCKIGDALAYGKTGEDPRNNCGTKCDIGPGEPKSSWSSPR